jgi:hypothetical protein
MSRIAAHGEVFETAVRGSSMALVVGLATIAERQIVGSSSRF